MSDLPTKPTPARKRVRGLRVALLVLGCLLPLACIFAYRYYTRPHRVRAMAEAFLQRHINGRVRVGGAKWSWLPNLRLFNVTIDRSDNDGEQGTPDRAGEAEAPVFFCPEIRLELGLASMLLGKPTLESIQAIEPSCAVARDAKTGRFNVDGLLRLAGLDDHWPPRHLPNVELRDARIRLIDRHGNGRQLVEDMTINVRARPWNSVAQGYDVTWQVKHGRPSSGHTRVDLRTGRARSVIGGLPWLHVRTLALAANAKNDTMELWRDRLGLTGSVRISEFDLGGAGSGGPIQSAVVELSGATLSVPVGDEERSMPADQRHLRFDHVDGKVELKPDELTVNLTGLVHGSACAVSAAIHRSPGGTGDTGLPLGDFASAGLDAEVTIQGVTLPINDPDVAPAQARFIRHVPALAKVYTDYDPHGMIDLGLTVSKPIGAKQPLTLKRLHVNMRGADFSASKFPYRVRDAHGTIERGLDGTMVFALQGLGAKGAISIDGTFGKETAEDNNGVSISAKGIPLDDAFWLALPSRFMAVRRQFSPDGLVDLEVALTPTRMADGSGIKWQARTDVSLVDVAATYDRFPYPLNNLTGTIAIDRGTVTVSDLVGHSDQAVVTLNGSFVVDADGLTYLDIGVEARDVPINDRLMAALPESARREVDVFHARGNFDSHTSLSFNTRDHKIEQVSVVSLHGAAVRCDLFPLPITNVAGQLRITDTETHFEDISGRFRDATFEASGVSRRGVEGSSVHATIRGHDVRLDEETRRWLPASVLDQLGPWNIEGPIATETVLTGDPAGPHGLSHRTRLTLAGATVFNPQLPVPATDVRGVLVVDQGGLRSMKLTAKYDSADVVFAYNATEGSDGRPDSDASISAVGLTLNDSVRGLLPPRLSRAWPRINPVGQVDVYLDEVRWKQSPEGADPQYAVRGRVELEDVSLGHDDFITRSNGTIKLDGVIHDVGDGSLLRGTLALSRTDVFDHRIDQATGEWSFASRKNGDGMLVLNPMQGRIHGGLISGDVNLEFTSDQLDYTVTTTARNMSLQSFLGAANVGDATPGSAGEARGTVHGCLKVVGMVDGESSPRGSGKFEIVDGHMYRLPLILGILHVLNLSIPSEDAFEEARGDFLVVGDRIDLKDIRMQGDALALSGAGFLSWPDRAVDLTLVSVGRENWTREVPLLAELIGSATKELVGVHVTGKLSNPRIRLEPFRAIREEFQMLFKKKKPKPVETIGS